MGPLDEVSTNLNIDEQGRMTLSKEHREALGIDGEEVYARVSVEPLSINGVPADKSAAQSDK